MPGLNRRPASLVALWTLGVAPAALAGPYAGIAIGDTRYANYGNVGSAIGEKVSIGYELDSTPLFLDAAYLNIGNHDARDYTGLYKLGFRGGDVSLGWIPWRSRRIGLTTWVKGGYYRGQAQIKSVYYGGAQEATSGGASLDIGVKWQAASWFGLQLEFSNLFKVKDSSVNERSDVEGLYLGAVFTLPDEPVERPGRGRRAENPELAPPQRVEAPAPAPAAEIAESPPPMPAAAPESAAAVSPPASPTVAPATEPAMHAWARGQTAVLKPGARLRVRPVAGADPVSAAPDTHLTLEGGVVNAGGRWWHASWNGGTGWVLDGDIEAPR